MSQNLKAENSLFTAFDSLHAAVIDASSIIYMKKADFLPLAMQFFQMHAPNDVYNETGFSGLSIILHIFDKSITADKQIILLAQNLVVPVISEDKGVLIEASRKDIPYYNSLMILNCLLYKKQIAKEDFGCCIRNLSEVARYSKFVISYGKMVTKEICDRLALDFDRTYPNSAC